MVCAGTPIGSSKNHSDSCQGTTIYCIDEIQKGLLPFILMLCKNRLSHKENIMKIN
jgi:hypothetical protein